MGKGKRFDDAAKGFDRDHQYGVSEAIALSKGMAKAKFDETIEVIARLGVDPRKADEMVRGTVALPSGTGRDVRVAVFAQGEKPLRPPAMPAPTSSATTTSPVRSRAACSTSTSPSPAPT